MISISSFKHPELYEEKKMQVLSSEEINNRFKRKRNHDVCLQSRSGSNRCSTRRSSDSESSESSLSELESDDGKPKNREDEVDLLEKENAHLRSLVLGKSKKCRKYKKEIKRLRKRIDELIDLNFKYQNVYLTTNAGTPSTEPIEFGNCHGNDSVTDDNENEIIGDDEDYEYKDILPVCNETDLEAIDKDYNIFGAHQFTIDVSDPFSISTQIGIHLVLIFHFILPERRPKVHN